MQEQFVKYEQAVALKELGFDKPCFGQFYKHPSQEKEELRLFQDCDWNDRTTSYWGTNISPNFVSAPTFSQAFEFFREKYGLHSFIDIYPTKEEPNRCWFMIRYIDRSIEEEEDYMSGWFSCQNKAESACINKLIEIVKNK